VLQLQALLKHFVRMITAQKYRIDVTPASCTANHSDLTSSSGVHHRADICSRDGMQQYTTQNHIARYEISLSSKTSVQSPNLIQTSVERCWVATCWLDHVCDWVYVHEIKGSHNISCALFMPSGRATAVVELHLICSVSR
jgi:hypothetical protein